MDTMKSKVNNSKSIGAKIKVWRKKNNLTQDALAKKANIPYTTLTKIESDVIKNPSIQTMAKIAEGLEITIDELFRKD
jgi:transcriptional regulator with XRE-family HTH domain